MGAHRVLKRGTVVRLRGTPPNVEDPRWVRIPKRIAPSNPQACSPPQLQTSVIISKGDSKSSSAMDGVAIPVDPFQRAALMVAEKARQDFPMTKVGRHSPGFKRPENNLRVSNAYTDHGLLFVKESPKRRFRSSDHPDFGKLHGSEALEFDHRNVPMKIRRGLPPRGGAYDTDISARRLTFDGPKSKAHHHFHFTFDDGPNMYSTPILLDILKKHSVRATFFFVGGNIDDEEILQRIVREGHFIGSHTFDHDHLNRVDVSVLERTLVSTEKVVERMTGKQTFLIRPPYGEVSPAIHDVLMKRGYLVVGWDVDTNDWQTTKPHQVTDQLLRFSEQHEAAIVLMHEFLHTTLSLDVSIKKLRERGVEILPLEDLLLPEEKEHLFKSYECDSITEDDLYAFTCRLLSGDPNWFPSYPASQQPPGTSELPSQEAPPEQLQHQDVLGGESPPTPTPAPSPSNQDVPGEGTSPPQPDVLVAESPPPHPREEEQQQGVDAHQAVQDRVFRTLAEEGIAKQEKQLSDHARRVEEHQNNILSPPKKQDPEGAQPSSTKAQVPQRANPPQVETPGAKRRRGRRGRKVIS